MFAAAKFPISFWNSTWWYTRLLLGDPTKWQGDPTWYAQPNRDLLFALKYHERLHNCGEDFTQSYMPPSAYDWIGYDTVSGGIDDDLRVDWNKSLEHENGFADSLRVLDELIPYKIISPVSLNYSHISRQKSHHVASAAMLPDGRLLTHVAWRPGGGLIRVKSRTTIIKDGRGRYHELPGTPVNASVTDPCTTGIWLVAR
jgi:hypothetical protein